MHQKFLDLSKNQNWSCSNIGEKNLQTSTIPNFKTSFFLISSELNAIAQTDRRVWPTFKPLHRKCYVSITFLLTHFVVDLFTLFNCTFHNLYFYKQNQRRFWIQNSTIFLFFCTATFWHFFFSFCLSKKVPFVQFEEYPNTEGQLHVQILSRLALLLVLLSAITNEIRRLLTLYTVTPH